MGGGVSLLGGGVSLLDDGVSVVGGGVSLLVVVVWIVAVDVDEMLNVPVWIEPNFVLSGVIKIIHI